MPVRSSSVVLTFALLVLAEPQYATGRAPRTPARHNVVWITIDALRADHLGFHGYARKTSPFLDSLASGAVVFERAISQESYTQASVPSFFTSTYPRQHGVLYDNPEIDVLRPDALTIAEILHQRGYATAAFVFNPHLHRKYGFDQGFEIYDDYDIREESAGSEPLFEHMETARKIDERVVHYLAHQPRRPVFLYLHYFDVHEPYTPPPPFYAVFLPQGIAPLPDLLEVRHFSKRRDLEVLVSQYDGEILYTDTWLRTTFDRLARNGLVRDNTVFVISSDHGEEFNDPHPDDRGGFSHGRTLHLEQIHVPLLLLVPRLPPRRVGSWVELTDVAPTLLAALGIDPKDLPSLEGHSLLDLARGAGTPRPFVYSGGSHGRATLIAGDWKLERYSEKIRGHRKAAFARHPAEHERSEMLFHLARDPREREDLLPLEPREAERLRRLLAEREVQLAPARADSLQLDAETRKQLEALGYL